MRRASGGVTASALSRATVSLLPVGSPSADRVWPICPTAMVLETTIIPISDSVPCQAVADRAPPRRPAE